MSEVRIVVTNQSPDGGTFLTPVWFGFHDDSFDLFDVGAEASAGLERIAEDGTFAAIGAELLAADADGQGGVITGAAGPVATGETTSSAVIDVDGSANPLLSFAAMILPSNDAFIGTDAALTLFDENGVFLGEQSVAFLGSDVLDAGTEVNTELDAAFINQTAPDTGIDQDGLIAAHPGFNGSLGNPIGEGDQIILGGTNAAGELVDPVVADFTRPGSTIATVHVNTVNSETGGAGRDRLKGGDEDDLFDGAGGNDILHGKRGWDELLGGAGNDKLFGGLGNDLIDGGAGNDKILAGRGDDFVILGTGDDRVHLGKGDNTVVFGDGDGDDTIFKLRDGDTISLHIAGVEDFADVLDAATGRGGRTVLDFGDGDSLTLKHTSLDELSADTFLFG